MNRGIDPFRALVWLTMAMPLAPAFADEWPQFRGPGADGVVRSDFPQNWDESTNIRWKIPIEGEGWSCPVVWGEKVFLTVAEKSETTGDESEAPAEPGNSRRRRPSRSNESYRWVVACLDANSGKEIWRQVAREGQPTIPRHHSNSYATETPVTDGERVYAYFGMTGLYCYDMAGKPLWSKDLGVYPMRAGWGTSSSPVLFDGKLFLQIDNEAQSFLVALDASTGEEVWRVDRDEPSQYSTPLIWTNSQRQELIVGGQLYRSYNPTSGELLWQLDMQRGRSCSSPLAVQDRLYVGTELRSRGGPDDGGGFLFAVKPGGAGDITPAGGAGEYVDWKLDRSGIQMASPVLCAGHLYVLERRGAILHCVNAETGEKVYQKRIPGGRAFWASPWTDGEQVYCLDEVGTTYVLAGGPELEVIGKNPLDGQAWSTPAVANGALFLRTTENLYCIASP